MSLLPEDLTLVALLNIEKPPGMTIEDLGTYEAGLHGRSIVDTEVVKSFLSMAIVTGGRTRMNHYRV
jgi:hypothetical protein